MSMMIPLKNDEKEAVVDVLKEEIRQYREAISNPDPEGTNPQHAKHERWRMTAKLETLVSALTKIESQIMEASK